MTENSDMLAALESFVEDAIRINELADGAGAARKIDVLERVVELLRLHSGAMENRLRMDDLLRRGLEVSRGADGALRLLTVRFDCCWAPEGAACLQVGPHLTVENSPSYRFR